MTSDAILVVKFLFTTIWALFTSWYIPGTNVTPAAMFFFLLLAGFVLRTLAWLLGRADSFAPGPNEKSEGIRGGGKPL